MQPNGKSLALLEPAGSSTNELTEDKRNSKGTRCCFATIQQNFVEICQFFHFIVKMFFNKCEFTSKAHLTLSWLMIGPLVSHSPLHSLLRVKELVQFWSPG